MRRRFPDKPNEMSASQLPILDLQGGYIATAKQDGWRCMIEVDGNGKIEFLSRTWRPLPISPRLKDLVASMGLPKNTMLDTEWMARRADVTQETLHLITIPWFDDVWLGDQYETTRWARAVELMGKLPLEAQTLFSLPKWTDSEYSKLFEWSKANPSTEGIVLKRKNSYLIGHLRTSWTNTSWIKIKWRAGLDGQTRIA
jgi:ATP-dependent DNA ligase